MNFKFLSTQTADYKKNTKIDNLCKFIVTYSIADFHSKYFPHSPHFFQIPVDEEMFQSSPADDFGRIFARN